MSPVSQTRRIELLGHSPWPAEKILREARAGVAPDDLPGCFTLIATDGPAVTIITSAASGFLYCYHLAPDHGRLVHGRVLFDVVREAGLPWRWNRRALRALFLIDHTLGEETMHPDVRYVAPGTHLRFTPGSFVCETGSRVRQFVSGSRGQAARDAPAALLASLEDAGAAPPFLSLTAGHDSRMILAALLAQGQQPVVMTIGPAGCADRTVAAAIARDLGLEHREVEMHPDLYLTHARSAVRLTGGGKGASHWHMHLLCQQADLPAEALHLLGINGGFASTVLFDKGWLARFADRLPFDPTASFLRAKIGVRYRRAPWMRADWCRAILDWQPAFPDELCARIRDARGFLNRLDLLFLGDRELIFGGGDLSFAAARSRAAAPLLDRRWLAAVSALPRRERFAKRAMRAVIEHLFPALLDYPIGSGPPLRQRPRRLYWLRDRQATGYKAFDALVGRADVFEMLAESRGLDDFLNRQQRIAALQEGNALLYELLLTLHFTILVLQEEGVSVMAPAWS